LFELESQVAGGLSEVDWLSIGLEVPLLEFNGLNAK
jgi:hypothetical protein